MGAEPIAPAQQGLGESSVMEGEFPGKEACGLSLTSGSGRASPFPHAGHQVKEDANRQLPEFSAVWVHVRVIAA